MKKLTKAEAIQQISKRGYYIKVRIDSNNIITGVSVDEDYRYDKNTNTGGRRYIGRFDSQSDLNYFLNPETGGAK